jgi:tetratricopeptide (TPR) repeat protein
MLLELGEQFAWAHSIIALAEFFQGNLAESRQRADEAFRRMPLNPLAAGLLAGLLKQRGETEQVEKLLISLRELPLGMILHHVVCSESEAAIGWYEQAIEQRHLYAAEWASAGFLRPFALESWHKLAEAMNLPSQR